jgi:5-hydroxyisourate hydrolase-like protein (transthyretin family)
MEISVTVIDGIHGQPAEGVEVRVACRQDGPDGMEVERARARTNGNGQVRYGDRRAAYGDGERYFIEIDADIYFASLGIACWPKKVTVGFRVLNPEDEYQVMSMLTPFMQATYCVRRARA